VSKTPRKPIAEVRAENIRLRVICRDLQWMARRYADGRHTYAVGMVNDATRYLDSIGCGIAIDPPYGTKFARDGAGRMFDRLAPHEVGQDDPSEGRPTADDLAAKIGAEPVTETERAHRRAHAEGDLRMRR
jgi:hypothetical protein